MIWEDVRIEDIDAAHWANLFGLFAPDEADVSGGPGGGPRGRLLVLHRDGRVVKILPAGDAAERLGIDPLASLAELRERAGVRRVVALDVDAWRRIMDRAQRAHVYDADFIDQAVVWYDAVRAEMGRGIRVDPPGKPLAPVNLAMLRRIMGFLFTRPQVLALYVFDGPTVHTSLILGLRDAQVTRVTTHDALEATGFELQWGLLDAPRIVAELTRRYAPVRMGVFLERATWDRCWRRDTESWREAIAKGEVVFEPAPLPVDVVVFVLKTIRSVVGRV